MLFAAITPSHRQWLLRELERWERILVTERRAAVRDRVRNSWDRAAEEVTRSLLLKAEATVTIEYSRLAVARELPVIVTGEARRH